MNAWILGAGLFARGHSTFDGFVHAVAGNAAADEATTAHAPRPSRVPARELRRLPDQARLAVEVCDQACAAAGVAVDAVVPIFTSTLGDSGITDYMCRTLAEEQKLLSPLRFQNSVHNAPAGALSIATGNRQATGFVSAFENSFSLALLESLVLAQTQPLPVLLVTTDVPVPEPLSDVHGSGALGGAALLLAAQAPHKGGLSHLCSRVEAGRANPPDERSLPATHQAWPLLEALATGGAATLSFAVGQGSRLHVELSAGGAGEGS